MSPQTRAVHFLMNLRKAQRQTETMPPAFRPENIREAHGIQDELVSVLLSELGDVISGYKVATTSKQAQEMLNVDGPFSGQMPSRLIHTSGATLRRSDYTTPIAEPEFAFQVSAEVPLSDKAYTPDSILPYIGDLVPAIEIVDHRYNSLGTAGGHCILADNAIFGCVVLGEPVSDWRATDLAAHTVNFKINGAPFADGIGANALDHPLNVMAWLANDLGSRGKTLQAGQIVITGTVTAVHHAQAGDTIGADFGRFGTVTLSFE